MSYNIPDFSKRNEFNLSLLSRGRLYKKAELRMKTGLNRKISDDKKLSEAEAELIKNRYAEYYSKLAWKKLRNLLISVLITVGILMLVRWSLMEFFL